MIQGKKKEELTIDTVLNKISEFSIYSYYMPSKNWELNKITNSPFEEDKTPSFLIGNKYGHLTHIAFNDTSKRGDCFAFVKQLFNLTSLNQVLEKIDNDFGLGFRSLTRDYRAITFKYKEPIVTKRNTFIQVTARPFTKEELAYWNMYHQDLKDLKENNIYSIKNLYFNRQKFPLKDTELRFGYFYDGHWKIYRPTANKKNKWMPNNVPITMMDGKKDIQGCDVAFINKSKKDHMVIKKLFPCSCAVQNEGIACFSPENVEYIKSNCKTAILSFDSDITGVKNSQQITELFGFGYCNVPKNYLSEGIKDWAQLAAVHGLNAVEKVLKQKGILK